MWLKNGVAHKTNVYNNLQLVVLCTSSSTLQDYLEPCIQHSENIGPANNGKCSKNRYVVICLSFFSFRFVILDLCCHFIVMFGLGNAKQILKNESQSENTKKNNGAKMTPPKKTNKIQKNNSRAGKSAPDPASCAGWENDNKMTSHMTKQMTIQTGTTKKNMTNINIQGPSAFAGKICINSPTKIPAVPSHIDLGNGCGDLHLLGAKPSPSITDWPRVTQCQILHGAGIFSNISPKNHPNEGKYT